MSEVAVKAVSRWARRVRAIAVPGVVLAGFVTVLAPSGGATAATAAKVLVVAAENQYGDVVGQIGGPYVTVRSVMSNPNVDPHSFEASASVAEEVAQARLVVQNGLGYDSFMDTIEQASPSRSRTVIDVQTLLGLPSSTANPHLWYSPSTMPAVARAVAAALGTIEPSHKSYFAAALAAFDASMDQVTRAIAQLKASFPRAPVATTEPVGDDLLAAAGLDDETPWILQADIMNGVDPAPQDVTIEENLLASHRVRVFVYNQQVVDAVTAAFLSTAEKDHVPVVGVYETMPTPGYHYQSWMLAEIAALRRALADHVSTTRL